VVAVVDGNVDACEITTPRDTYILLIQCPIVHDHGRPVRNREMFENVTGADNTHDNGVAAGSSSGWHTVHAPRHEAGQS
jgi:2-C-methyl-D-erythritol 4-phosphate cytidylyltransferase